MQRFFFLYFILFSGCYSFKGTSIDPNIDTFFINRFELQLSGASTSAPPNLAFDFTESLKDKIRSQTRLNLANQKPDIEFSGKVTEYQVIPVAPQANEQVELNQLWISVETQYQNNQEGKENDNWTHKSRQYAEFSNTQDLISVQDELIRDLTERLTDDIINKAFNDW